MKRLFDLILSAIGLIILFPLFIVVGILIKWDSPGPVFYRGVRAGKDGKLFRVFKLRTMVDKADKGGSSVTTADDPRLTKIGKFVRKYNLDELPNLINVLKGEMSFVGPRPEVPYYVNKFTEEEKAILTVKPGITDWATLWNPDEAAALAGSADPDLAYMQKIRPEKIKLQLKYVREHSFWKDCLIMLQTLKVHLFDSILNRTKLPV